MLFKIKVTENKTKGVRRANISNLVVLFKKKPIKILYSFLFKN